MFVGRGTSVIEALDHMRDHVDVGLLAVLRAVVPVSGIGDRLAGQSVSPVLGDLVRAVLYDDVVDLWSSEINLRLDRLVAEEIRVKIAAIALVVHLHDLRLLEDRDHVVASDRHGRDENRLAPVEDPERCCLRGLHWLN